MDKIRMYCNCHNSDGIIHVPQGLEAQDVMSYIFNNDMIKHNNKIYNYFDVLIDYYSYFVPTEDFILNMDVLLVRVCERLENIYIINHMVNLHTTITTGCFKWSDLFVYLSMYVKFVVLEEDYKMVKLSARSPKYVISNQSTLIKAYDFYIKRVNRRNKAIKRSIINDKK